VLDKLGIGICHTLGFSFGGWIVYSLLRKYPERIRSMILLDGVPGPDDPMEFQDFANNIEELTHQSSYSPANKARRLNNDKIALLSLASGIKDDIPKIINDINNLSETINTPSLILTSDLKGIEMEFL
jgi:pimeloyl-ACP methyl ester carboxylesterase